MTYPSFFFRKLMWSKKDMSFFHMSKKDLSFLYMSFIDTSICKQELRLCILKNDLSSPFYSFNHCNHIIDNICTSRNIHTYHPSSRRRYRDHLRHACAFVIRSIAMHHKLCNTCTTHFLGVDSHNFAVYIP